MNYYERHLGDYAKDTAHLSMLEHGAYNAILDRYYSTEAGIPVDQTYRVARARTKEEKAAVDTVLGEFFQLVDGLWIKNRVEEEIQRYRDGVPAAEEKRENDKERQRRARERRKALFAELATHGIVLQFNTPFKQLQTELSRVTSRDSHSEVTPPVTRDNPAIHNPVSSLQSPSEDSRRGEDPPPVGSLKTQIYRLAGQLEIHAGVITPAIQAHSEHEVWQALGKTLAAKPAEALPYFRGCLKTKTVEGRFKSA